MVSTVEALRGRRRRAILIGSLLAVSVVLIVWSGYLYLEGVESLEQIRMQESRLTRDIERQRTLRGLLDTPEMRQRMSRVRNRLVRDPAEFPTFLDRLQVLGLKTGVELTYKVGDPQAAEFDPEIGWRELSLGFQEVDYPQLLAFTESLYQLSGKWLLEVEGLRLLENKGGFLLSGRFDVRLWTRRSGTELDSGSGGDSGSLTN